MQPMENLSEKLQLRQPRDRPKSQSSDALCAFHCGHSFSSSLGGGERHLSHSCWPMFPAAAGLASRHVIPAGMERTKKTNRGRTRADLLPRTSALPTILLTRFFFRFSWAPRISCCNTLSYSEFHPDWSFCRRPMGELVDWGAANGFLFVIGRSQCNQRIFLLNSIGWCWYLFLKFKCLFSFK